MSVNDLNHQPVLRIQTVNSLFSRVGTRVLGPEDQVLLYVHGRSFWLRNIVVFYLGFFIGLLLIIPIMNWLFHQPLDKGSVQGTMAISALIMCCVMALTVHRFSKPSRVEFHADKARRELAFFVEREQSPISLRLSFAICTANGTKLGSIRSRFPLPFRPREWQYVTREGQLGFTLRLRSRRFLRRGPVHEFQDADGHTVLGTVSSAGYRLLTAQLDLTKDSERVIDARAALACAMVHGHPMILP